VRNNTHSAAAAHIERHFEFRGKLFLLQSSKSVHRESAARIEHLFEFRSKLFLLQSSKSVHRDSAAVAADITKKKETYT